MEFTVKGGITLLSRRELGREEGEGLPVGINLLLENTADVRIGGISGEDKWSSGVRKGKKSSVRKGLFGLLKGMCHRSCPGKSFGRANESVSERTENGGGVGNKTAVEVDKAEKTLELLDRGGLRIVCDSLDMRGEGCDACGGNMMAEEVNGGLGKRTFFRINQDAIGSKDGENLVKVLEMLLEGRTGNEDVI